MARPGWAALTAKVASLSQRDAEVVVMATERVGQRLGQGLAGFLPAAGRDVLEGGTASVTAALPAS